jgi:hypothetical protein
VLDLILIIFESQESGRHKNICHVVVISADARGRQLLQIVPKGSGGVTDYARCLGEAMRKMGLNSAIFPASKTSVNANKIYKQVDESSHQTILLHLSSYGYGQRGVCVWLVREIERAKRERPDCSIITMFHELYAFGPPWKSAFWVSPLQRWIAWRLAELSDTIWTNTELHEHRLRRSVSIKVPIIRRPVFSNVGEPLTSIPMALREPNAALFGSSSTRLATTLSMFPHSESFSKSGVETVIEIGSGPGVSDKLHCSKYLGPLDASDVSAVLRKTQFGLLHYPSQYLAKSGVFAAYAAHGCVPIISGHDSGPSDGLQHGVHFLTFDDLRGGLDTSKIQQISNNVFSWYSGHALQGQALEMVTCTRCLSKKRRPL